MAEVTRGQRRVHRAGTGGFRVYKPGQGARVRWVSAAGAGIIVLGLAAFLQEQLTRVQNQWVEYLVPVGLLVLLGYGIFRLVGQSTSVVNFMIATEGEMKKVSWSSRREVLGATKVVIVTVLALGIILFVVDVVFMLFFERIEVLRIGLIARLFRAGAE
jgi:preprotein translocase subunit SecE